MASRVLTVAGRRPQPRSLAIFSIYGNPGDLTLLGHAPDWGLWVSVSRRIYPFLCPAGVTHRRYFREAHPRGGYANGGLACAHTTPFYPDPKLHGLTQREIDELMAD